MILTGNNPKPPVSASQPAGASRQAAGSVSLSPLRPSSWEVNGLICLTCIAFIAPEVLPVDAFSQFNIVISLCFGLVLSFGALRMVKANSFSLLSALFWFRIATVVYFAFGTAFVSFTSADNLAYVRGFYPFSPAEVLRLNQLVYTCTTTVIATIFLIEPIRPPAYLLQDPETKSMQNSGASIGLMFLIAGSVAHYGFVLPYQLNLTDEIYSSLTGNFSRLRLLGIFISVYVALKRKNGMIIPLTAYCVVDMILSFLTFSKSSVLFVQIMYLAPFVIIRPKFLRGLISVIVLAITFLLIQSVLGNLRVNFDNSNAATFQARLETVEEVIFSEISNSERQSAMASLARFSFVNAATLVMNQYDSGFASDWPKLIPTVAIPRAIWPEKPIITDIGVDIYALGSGGRTTSSSSAGYFADAYWAGGWTYSIVLSVFLALVLRMLSRFALRVFYYGRWLQMITVLLAMRIGLRVDGHYISDVFGALVFVGFFWGCCRVMEYGLPSFSRRSVSAGVRRRA